MESRESRDNVRLLHPVLRHRMCWKPNRLGSTLSRRGSRAVFRGRGILLERASRKEQSRPCCQLQLSALLSPALRKALCSSRFHPQAFAGTSAAHARAAPQASGSSPALHERKQLRNPTALPVGPPGALLAASISHLHKGDNNIDLSGFVLRLSYEANFIGKHLTEVMLLLLWKMVSHHPRVKLRGDKAYRKTGLG